MTQPLDYKDLLKKYMQLVYDSEAVTFVGYTVGYDFTEDELSHLKSIAKELGSNEDGL